MQGELLWIDGSTEEVARNHSSSVVWQQEIVDRASDGEREDVKGRNFQIQR